MSMLCPWGHKGAERKEGSEGQSPSPTAVQPHSRRRDPGWLKYCFCSCHTNAIQNSSSVARDLMQIIHITEGQNDNLGAISQMCQNDMSPTPPPNYLNNLHIHNHLTPVGNSMYALVDFTQTPRLSNSVISKKGQVQGSK